MIVLGVLQVIASAAAPIPDSVSLRAPRLDTVPVVAPAVAPAVSSQIASRNLSYLETVADPSDTVRKRRKAVEVSEWYGRRLTIHRYVAYATIPVFAMQYAAGEQLFEKGDGAPTWAKNTHRVGATALAGMFTVNTITGAWNWWDSRGISQGRVLRTIHALTILGADAAFTYTGAKLSNEAENSLDKRREHRTVALISIGATVVSGVAMKLWNH
jgi:hypothetical protein